MRGFVIAESSNQEIASGSSKYQLFTTDEWAYGNGRRYSEWETKSIEEAIEFIKDYKK